MQTHCAGFQNTPLVPTTVLRRSEGGAGKQSLVGSDSSHTLYHWADMRQNTPTNNITHTTVHETHTHTHARTHTHKHTTHNTYTLVVLTHTNKFVTAAILPLYTNQRVYKSDTQDNTLFIQCCTYYVATNTCSQRTSWTLAHPN